MINIRHMTILLVLSPLGFTSAELAAQVSYGPTSAPNPGPAAPSPQSPPTYTAPAMTGKQPPNITPPSPSPAPAPTPVGYPKAKNGACYWSWFSEKTNCLKTNDKCSKLFKCVKLNPHDGVNCTKNEVTTNGSCVSYGSSLYCNAPNDFNDDRCQPEN